MTVWNLAVRLSHWVLAATVLCTWIEDDGGRLHRMVGYVAVAAVALRGVDAVVERGAGRLTRLRPSPSATLAYLRALQRGTPARHHGHDPLGLWMVWLLWALVLGLGLTGWMSRLDAFWGDEWLQELHARLADLLVLAVAVHVAAVLLMSLLWRENLPRAMITGRKRPLDD